MIRAILNSNPYLLQTLFIFSFISLVAWKPVAKKFSWESLPTLAMLISVAGIFAFTLSPSGDESVRFQTVLRLPSIDELILLFSSLEGQLNVLLFIPFGFTSYLATKRFWPSLLVGIILSVTIEFLQAFPVVSRTSIIDDVIANTVGSAIGLVCAALIIKLNRHFTRL